jgi:uncharacterized membrane protein
MTSLLFLGCVAAIFLLVVAMEGDSELTQRLRRRPAGLLAWLTGGNWPAKLGAALVIIGVGALLRYAMLHVDIPAQAKLAAGLVIAAALGFASVAAPTGPGSRTLSLALGGAAFGVAYLTAYSAFALFGYVPSGTGLTLLVLVSAGAGIYAVTRGAMALGILAMFGAYLAPAFAVGDPGPMVVYSYYAAASLMTLVLVALRGWRPLIHLSFLFTLAGGGFLAWTSQYYAPEHASVMMPMLLLLAALHVAMPVVERETEHAAWVHRLDVLYMIALPSVVALLTFGIAASRTDLSVMMLWFGAIWMLAAAATRLRNRGGAAALLTIAALFLVLAAAARFRNIPWELLGMTGTVAMLALATWRKPQAASLHGVLAGFVVLFGYLQVLSTLDEQATGPIFANGVFLTRLTGALLFIIAGFLCRRARQVLDSLLLATGVLWLFISIGMELIRWDIATVPLVAHWAIILLAASVWIPGRKLLWADRHATFLSLLLALTAWWASHRAGPVATWCSLLAAGSAGLALAARMARLAFTTAADRNGPVVGTVLTAAMWSIALAPAWNSGGVQFVLTVAGVTTLLAMLLVHWVTQKQDPRTDDLLGGAAMCFATTLAIATLVHISREPAALLLELCCVAGLALALLLRYRRGGAATALTVGLVTGVALVLQAWLVRALGPQGELGIGSLFKLRQPALISLLWAAMGCVLTFWSRRTASRPLWIAGATLLIATAVKMMLLDFGSLGQLTNILAVIAAGVVFLAVGWLAPMPPAAEKGNATPSRQPNRMAIMIAITIGLFEAAIWYRKVAPEHPQWQLAPAPAAKPDLPAVPVAEPAEPAESESAVQVAEPTPVEEVAPDPAPVTVPAPTAARDATRAPARPEPPREYVRPPVVDATGTANYNDYSYPVRKAQSDQDARNAQFTAPPSPGEGDKGIDTLLRQGRMIPATQRDMDEYMSRVRGEPGATQRLREGNRMVLTQPLRRVYVARREFTMPSGLYGANLITVIVPRGVPRPFGDPGHSFILEFPPVN